MSFTSFLLPLLAASFTSAQFTTLPSTAPAAAAGAPPATTDAPSAAATTGDPYDCPPDSTNCLIPDVMDTGFYNYTDYATPVANSTATISFIEIDTNSAGATVTTTEVAVETGALYSDGEFYPDFDDADFEGGDLEDPGNWDDYGDGDFNGTYPDDAYGDYNGTYDDIDSLFNDTEPLIVTYNVSTTAANPNGGKPINTVVEVTETIDMSMPDETAMATMTAAATSDSVAAIPTGSGDAAAPAVTNGPIGSLSTAPGTSATEKRKRAMFRRRMARMARR